MSKGAKAGDVICSELIDAATKNRDILAVTSDSRGSASLNPFAAALPDQLIEMGIAEQNSVTVSAGMAHSGKRPFVFSPASFLTMRSIEQVKDDVAYSNTNVKLIGISGGNSYSVLGATHHSLQDLAITRAIPNLQVYMPADQYQTAALIQYLTQSAQPAYVRIGKKVLPDIYADEAAAFTKPGKGNVIYDKGNDVTLISAGETLSIALDAAQQLEQAGIHAKVVDLVSIKPLDVDLLNRMADQTHHFVTLEEHSIYGGLGSAVAEAVAPRGDTKVDIIGFPDEPVIAGTQDEVFQYYGMDAASVVKKVQTWLQ
ncbi:transketolase, beta subunit [Lactobacillus selangorensis]|uniref:Transketolase, beta subunit n=1 Tax=Lactobacillus selangorensis TaxID=81857 RepID=A0A0R2FXC8_9LACO|nr:transketolase C-terminal domain-containing protein [Lactobacillus selangorensis]KRN28573.1 transketolase, beta subunit [Lactobacillus selangorensis]KRN33017.1 transketolase, beta subunit [Lactobacillus selangorensis]